MSGLARMKTYEDGWGHGAFAATVKASVSLDGIGLHTGQNVSLTIRPAAAGTGILFRRTDLLRAGGLADQAADLERVTIKASPDAVTATTLGTVISNRHNVSISTVEHVLSALAGLGIDHALIEVNGPEVPIMDGSAAPFVDLLDRAGRRVLNTPRRILRLVRPVRVQIGESVISARPLPENVPLRTDLAAEVVYSDPAIGRQAIEFSGGAQAYREQISAARTFCYLSDVEMMRERGLALGGSLDNAIVVDNGSVLNEGGLRFPTEFVRHKVLDFIGDVYLLGAPLAAQIVAVRPGHTINTAFAQAVVAEGAAVACSLADVEAAPTSVAMA